MADDRYGFELGWRDWLREMIDIPAIEARDGLLIRQADVAAYVEKNFPNAKIHQAKFLHVTDLTGEQAMLLRLRWNIKCKRT